MGRLLTRQQAVKAFRDMWTWIANKSVEKRVAALKTEYFEEHGLSPISCDCYLCEYIKQVRGTCDDCPIIFGEGVKCNSPESPFQKWCDADIHDYKRAAKLALQIAQLPEKEVEEVNI